MRFNDLSRACRAGTPTFLTLLALIAGTGSVYCSLFSISADVVNPDPWRLRAALLIMLALVLDGLDGNLARLLKAESTLGAELDTFVDLTAFGIAPALLMYSVADGYPPSSRAALGIALISSGAWRLARFKTVDPYRGQRGYLGLPITACASLVALAVIATRPTPDHWGFGRFDLSTGSIAILWLAGIALLAFLQVSHIRYPKPSKNPAFFLPGVLLMVSLWMPYPLLSASAAWIGLLAVCAYALFAPFFHPSPSKTLSPPE